jgi:hypothetical protein
MHPLQAQLSTYAADVTNKVAAADDPPATGGTPRLWQYVDPVGGEFYLPEKLLTLHSPYTGKTFTTKPEKSTLSDVGKHLKEKAKQARIDSAAAFHPEQGKLASKVVTVEDKLAAAGAPVLFRYSDPESGKDFYLPKKLMSVRSPYTGKVFQAKPDRSTISEVSKELKGKGAADTETSKVAAKPWEAEELKEMEGLLSKHGYDPKDAKKLQKEGVGPFELAHRIKTTTPGEVGSLEYTHNLKKKASEEPASEGAWKVDFPVNPAETKPKNWKNEDGE